MRIQHNIMAMNAYRNYNNNASALSKNLEKLSSGYKINRAGDDAAGLAISEKMRAQITGLNAAQKNVKDGVSLVKTAEGAMQEIQDMLNRMDYLATQSANGTYDNEVDRANLQKEVDALKTEINRIADSANFNGINLLDGSVEKSAAKGITISGAERILSTVIGDDEKAWEVSGNKTILDSAAAKPASGAFQIDLSTLQFTPYGTSSNINTGRFTLSIGSKSWTAAAATGITATSANADIIDAIASNIASAMGSEVELNGMKWEVDNLGGGKFSFTQLSIPVTKEQAKCTFDVKVSLETPGKDNGVAMDSSHLEGTQVTKQAVAAEGANMANTVFKMSESDIRDGAKITIGTKSVILAVGADSQYYSASATNVVDLRHMKEGDINLADALGRISKTYGKTAYVAVKDNSGADATATFTVGFNDGSNGEEVGITIQRKTKIGTGSTEIGAYFNTKEKLAEVFSMSYTKAAQNGLTLQIGDTSESFNQMEVSIGDMHTTAMGIAGIDISNQAGAQAAVQTIKDAINYVSGIRGDLGAVQNRLEHTQNNLSVMAENIQDAESTIRDTDVAEEMMSYVKNNILVQSAQAMLAQANQVPQGVLQLLG